MTVYTPAPARLALPIDNPLPIFAVAARTDQYAVHVARSDTEFVDQVRKAVGTRRIALITDEIVAELHGRRVADRLSAAGCPMLVKVFPPGEASKTLDTAVSLLDWLARTEFARRDVVLAMGGGVVLDTVGWVASAYMRGVAYVNAPTSLLAQVDAALGGKVAVNHPTAKNLIGGFYQPAAVVSNVAFLATLEPRHMSAGLAEAIKKGVIASPDLFRLIEAHLAEIMAGNPDLLSQLVRGASVVKCALVSPDPYETDLRRPLNFGHTIGHAVETVSGYGAVLHGEAVSFGMAVACRISQRRRLLSGSLAGRIVSLLRRAGLPTSLSDLPEVVSAKAVLAALQQVLKIRDGNLNFVLPIGLGEVGIANDVTEVEISDALHDDFEPALTLAGSAT